MQKGKVNKLIESDREKLDVIILVAAAAWSLGDDKAEEAMAWPV